MTDGMAMLQSVKTGGFCCNWHLDFFKAIWFCRANY